MSRMIDYELSAHAVTVMAEREILEMWVARVLTSPERTEPDATDPLLRHALGRIPDRDDRVLRVVYNETIHPWRVVTA
jgi:Domain of unknown function (DUF4258)